MNAIAPQRHIDELMRLFQEDPSDETLTQEETLRLAYEFHKLQDTDRECLLAGIYTGRMSDQVRVRGLISRAEQEYAERRYEDCIKTTTDVLEISPSNLGGFCIRAIAYAQSNRDDRVERARKDLAEAGRIITFLGGDIV